MSEPLCVDGVLEALRAQPARGCGAGRALLFVSARRGEGAARAACGVAQSAGSSPVYAIDLDLRRNGLAKALAETAPLGPKLDGRFGGVSFYAVRGARGTALQETKPAFSFHRVGRSAIFAGVFDAGLLPKQARVAVSSGPSYWDAAREAGATIIVDSPALDRSDVALRVARHMDGVVLLVDAAPGGAPAAIATKTALLNAGANLIGLVYSGADAPVLAMERLLRQAG